MKEAMYLHKSKENRLKMMHENADGVEEVSYRKAFSKTEMAEMKDELVQAMIDLNNLELELTDIKEVFKDKMAPIKTAVGRFVTHLESGDREVLEPCFKFIDRETVQVGYYNESGVLVRERPANHNEMQLTIKHQTEET